MDDLFKNLNTLRIGCIAENVVANHLLFTDDLVQISSQGN